MQETLLHGLDQLCSTHHPHNYCEVESEQWINSVDRGGLVHVTHDTFMIFHSMEMELRQHFNKQRIADMQDESRTQLKESIVADVDVQFYMDRAADELEKEEKSELLRMIVDIYIVVRGFALHAHCWNPTSKYKKRHCKNLVVFERVYMCLSRKIKHSCIDIIV